MLAWISTSGKIGLVAGTSFVVCLGLVTPSKYAGVAPHGPARTWRDEGDEPCRRMPPTDFCRTMGFTVVEEQAIPSVGSEIAYRSESSTVEQAAHWAIMALMIMSAATVLRPDFRHIARRIGIRGRTKPCPAAPLSRDEEVVR